MIKAIKKAVKWYLEKSANTYTWVPSGMVPYIRN